MDTIALPCSKQYIYSVLSPHVWVSIKHAGVVSKRVLARLDTGSDITVLPWSLQNDIGHVLPSAGSHVFATFCSGPISAGAYYCEVIIWNGENVFARVRPKLGIFLGRSSSILLGMDVLLYFRLEGYRDKWTLQKV